MLILVVVDICSTECMLVLVAVDICGTKHMLILVVVDICDLPIPSLNWDLSVIIGDVNQLPSWEALHVFLSVLPNQDDLHAHLVNGSKVHVCAL
jgi:hypothetical protein